jgi:hypothetical protein
MSKPPGTEIEQHWPGVVQQGEDPQRVIGGDQVETGRRKPILLVEKRSYYITQFENRYEALSAG